MNAKLIRIGLALVVCLVFAVGSVSAAPVTYTVTLNGANEAPPNASPGTGTATVVIDAVAHTMSLNVSFSGLNGNVSACHIHAATAVAGVGTAGVATTTPTFAGFPGGVTFGVYVNTLNTTLATSWNGAYITANGGTTATAETALFAAIAAGKAYLNIHTNVVPGGEIRGFLLPVPVATEQSTWGNVKALYR